MKLEIGKEILNDYTKASSREWLETNGLGGYSSSTLSGAHTRSYHGLYVTATNPPVGREVLLSRLEEEVFIEGKSFLLSCNQFPNFTYKAPLAYSQKFTKDPFPTFYYKIKEVEIRKTISFLHNSNDLVITYEVLKASNSFHMELKPYVAFRDFHSLGRANDQIEKKAVFYNNTLHIQPYADHPPLYIYVERSGFRFNPAWAYDFEYAMELSRGLKYHEDLFMHGQFLLQLKEGDKICIIVSTDFPEDTQVTNRLEEERKRREKLYSGLSVKDDFTKVLALAADQFLVKRGELKTIIAGYHWFSDWGRDTMISIPGLCLVNGRFNEAKKILKAFALSMDRGMIPNRFPDESETPEYNTVDATLWYFIAVWKYYEYAKDDTFLLNEMLPVLEEVIKWHKRGTRYHIHIDTDGLLFAGENGVQLTWMDAKVGDWVVTPRQGKPVEINALWYNAIKIIGEIYKLKGDEEKIKEYQQLSDKIKEAFLEKFLYKKGGYLYDCITETEKSTEIRPNQLFALSLPFELLNIETARSILKIVEQKLLTPYGLRSLSESDKSFIGTYGGDPLSRDGAYHQGTVWSWLLGPYITAKIKIEGDPGRQEIKRFLKAFEIHFMEAGIGTVSEIFDGSYPYRPNGCIAQAWGVAELLRAYIEDVVVPEEKSILKDIKDLIA